MVVRRGVAVAVAVALMALVGCGDDDTEAKPDPTPTITSSPSASPSASEAVTPKPPVLPTMPAAARGSGDEAARAFARYWIAMVNYAQSTGDTEPLSALHADYCSGCSAGVEQVKKDWSKGKSIVGGRYKILKLNSLESKEPVVHVVAISTKQGRLKLFGPAGHLINNVNPGLTGFRVYLRRDNGGWVVGAAEVLQ